MISAKLVSGYFDFANFISQTARSILTQSCDTFLHSSSTIHQPSFSSAIIIHSQSCSPRSSPSRRRTPFPTPKSPPLIQLQPALCYPLSFCSTKLQHSTTPKDAAKPVIVSNTRSGTFTLFPTLSTELQDQIWKHHLDDSPRPPRFYEPRYKHANGTLQGTIIAFDKNYRRTAIILPDILRISPGSRNAGNHLLGLSHLRATPGSTLWPGSLLLVFNPSRDTLVFNEHGPMNMSIDTFARSVCEVSIHRNQHLAFIPDRHRRSGHDGYLHGERVVSWLHQPRREFGGLRTLGIWANTRLFPYCLLYNTVFDFAWIALYCAHVGSARAADWMLGCVLGAHCAARWMVLSLHMAEHK
jgi:hypothetical protein